MPVFLRFSWNKTPKLLLEEIIYIARRCLYFSTFELCNWKTAFSGYWWISVILLSLVLPLRMCLKKKNLLCDVEMAKYSLQTGGSIFQGWLCSNIYGANVCAIEIKLDFSGPLFTRASVIFFCYLSVCLMILHYSGLISKFGENL